MTIKLMTVAAVVILMGCASERTAKESAAAFDDAARAHHKCLVSAADRLVPGPGTPGEIAIAAQGECKSELIALERASSGTYAADGRESTASAYAHDDIEELRRDAYEALVAHVLKARAKR